MGGRVTILWGLSAPVSYKPLCWGLPILSPYPDDETQGYSFSFESWGRKFLKSTLLLLWPISWPVKAQE